MLYGKSMGVGHLTFGSQGFLIDLRIIILLAVTQKWLILTNEPSGEVQSVSRDHFLASEREPKEEMVSPSLSLTVV